MGEMSWVPEGVNLFCAEKKQPAPLFCILSRIGGGDQRTSVRLSVQLPFSLFPLQRDILSLAPVPLSASLPWCASASFADSLLDVSPRVSPCVSSYSPHSWYILSMYGLV